MSRRVRGEQTLPGATEELLQATKSSQTPADRAFVEYLAVSVLRSADGTYRAYVTTLDPGSRRVLPQLLDAWEGPRSDRMTLAEVVLYWAQQRVLDERGVLD